MKMELKLLILVCLQGALLGAYHVQARSCEWPTNLSGMISYSSSRYESTPGYNSYTTPGYDRRYTRDYDYYTSRRSYAPSYFTTPGYGTRNNGYYTSRRSYAPSYFSTLGHNTRRYDYTPGYNTRGYDYTGGFTRDYDYTRGYNTRGYDYTGGYTRDYDYTRGYNSRGYDYTGEYNTRRYDYTTSRYDYTQSRDYTDKCWFIKPPQEYYTRLSIVEMNLGDPYCDYAYIEVEDHAGKKTRICQPYYNSEHWSDTFLGEVTVTVVIKNDYWRREDSSFKMKYHIESVACGRNDSFRCSQNQCIYPDQVCDGKIDCYNGIDEECEIPVVWGVNATRNYAIHWLKRRQTETGWGRNTHRAITALYLSGANKFQGARTEEEIMVKELQLKAMAALLRNTTSLLSVNELSMYVNSLMVTCHDLRNFYGYDLLKILSSRAFASSSPSPGAYLTLCNAGWPLPEDSVPRLLQLLKKDSGYPFAFEIQAMTVMALSCIRQKTKFDRSWNEVYNGTIENFMTNQRDDGSFGNAHTTAMVSQALTSSGILSKQWDYVGAVRYLMRNVNSSSVDFLSVYLSLPIFNGKTLLNIGSVDCSGFQRKFENDDDDISEVVDRMGGNTSVQYSLYIGNNKEVVQTIYLKVPENSTALDVMKLAQMADHKYKFSFSKMQDHVYIYKIGGMSNDMEVGKFWLLFKADSGDKAKLDELYTTSPDQIVMINGDHLIMWYKMADF